MSRKYKYIRKINDYSCYIETKEKDEQFLLDLSQELKKFGLSLNNKKQKLWSYLYLLIMNGLASFNSIS